MEKDNTEDVKTDEELKREDDPSPDEVKVWAVVAILLSFPVAAVVEHYYDSGRGRAAGLAFALMIGAARAFWYLRRHVWFWLTVAALVMLHGMLVVAVPWRNGSLPARGLWPFAIVDLLAMFGIIKLVEKVMTRTGEVRLIG